MRSRKSSRSPFITPSTTMRAVTPTATPPVEITVLSDAVREFRRLRR
jgi:hypothetical protein